MRLGQLVRELGGALSTGGARAGIDPEVLDVRLDSRQVTPGTLFAALSGSRDDGARHVADAARQGACGVLSPRPVAGVQLPLWEHDAARVVAGRAAALVHGRPVQRLRTVGITGTNGKSTTAHLVGELLRHAGHRPAVIGTVEVRLWGEDPRPSTHTTPDAPELQRLARRQLELGGDSIALEVSSHALDQERLAGFELDVGVFTNLGRDHLDYHADLESYARAKERLFQHLRADGAAVINADDPAAERMTRAARARGARVFTYGTRSHADLSADIAVAGSTGTTLFLEGMGIPRTGYFLPLAGRHNVENALAAVAAVLFLGASPETVVSGLATLSAPRGRLQPIDTGERGFQVFVDYAHTPEALERVLTTLRSFLDPGADSGGSAASGGGGAASGGRLICVFGCGGNRDREKRAPMGAAVGRLADLALVTSDNPRDEDPRSIIEDILPGLHGARAALEVEPDRRKAIARALAGARRGDVVLIAGRGHEQWQQLRDERVPFEDPRVVCEELR